MGVDLPAWHVHTHPAAILRIAIKTIIKTIIKSPQVSFQELRGNDEYDDKDDEGG